jgi:hypothetical protein
LNFLAKFAWPTFAVCSFVLFAPLDFLTQAGMIEVRNHNRPLLWIALIFTGTICLTAIAKSVWKGLIVRGAIWLADNRQKSKASADRTQAIERILSSLNDAESMWISCCVYFGEQTLVTQLDNPTAQSLVAKGILQQGGGSVLRLPFHLRSDVWDMLEATRDTWFHPDEATDPELKQRLLAFKRQLADPLYRF